MGVVLALIILAILIAGVGFLVELALWGIIIAAALVIAGAVLGWIRRETASG